MNPPSKYNYHQANCSSRRRSATRNRQDQHGDTPSPSAMMNRDFPGTAPLVLRSSPFRPLSECTPQERMIRLKAVTQAALAIVNLPLRYDEDTPNGSSQ
ncbi:unnamed protein product [Cylindrotheca closterium]|uniref:Uncharacterized protein n=1 Tax=Cylindrotheca closterium TaxID=2856 RepID=A0AAD2CKN0_9STRA|nr:unnamed protein product [Cylindrotheca closterium]